jgi:hypothetical protein
VFGADYIPLEIGAFYSPSNKMDIGAAIEFPDVKNSAGDFYAIFLTARLFKLD